MNDTVYLNYSHKFSCYQNSESPRREPGAFLLVEHIIQNDLTDLNVFK